MTSERFQNIANFLFTNAQHLSQLAYQNLIQTRQIVSKIEAEDRLRRRNRELRRASRATVISLANLAEFRDTDTGDHVVRVALLAHEIARTIETSNAYNIELGPNLCRDIGVASVLHDIGKITIPDNILLKPAALDATERSIIEGHAEAGARILKKSSALAFDTAYLELATEIALYHHERFDGTGYPSKHKRDAVPVSARIVAVADVYDALTCERPYKKAWSHDDATIYLKENAGTQFDPQIVAAALEVLRERRAVPGICWTEDMSVGNALLDRDHSTMISVINQMSSPANRLDTTIQEFVLDELVSQVVGHFAREEAHMRDIGFSGIERHIDIHRAIENHLNEFRSKFFDDELACANDFWSYIANDIMTHIRTEDKLFVI